MPVAKPWDLPPSDLPKKPYRPRCKACRSKNVIPIVYNREVTEELLAAQERGELMIGGAAIYGQTFNWHCKECGCEFLR